MCSGGNAESRSTITASLAKYASFSRGIRNSNAATSNPDHGVCRTRKSRTASKTSGGVDGAFIVSMMNDGGCAAYDGALRL